MSATIILDGEEHSVEDIAEAIVILENEISKSEAIVRLSKSDDFAVFKKAFVDGFNETALANSHNFTEQGDARFLTAYKARAILLSFIREQSDNIMQYREDAKELREALENGNDAE